MNQALPLNVDKGVERRPAAFVTNKV